MDSLCPMRQTVRSFLRWGAFFTITTMLIGCAVVAPSSVPSTPVASPPAAANRSGSPAPTVIATATESVLLAPPGWQWFRQAQWGFALLYPAVWSRRVDIDQGRATAPSASPGAVRYRLALFSPETNAEILVDVYDLGGDPAFDLRGWAETDPVRAMGVEAGPFAYNASLGGQPAIFSFVPGLHGGDSARVLFTAGDCLFRVSYHSVDQAAMPGEAAIYRAVLESIVIDETETMPVSLPSGWERGQGLLTRFATPTEPGTGSTAEYLHLRGTLDTWVNEFLGAGSFTLAAEDGKAYAVQIAPFQAYFRGVPIDQRFDALLSEPQGGEQVMVVGEPLPGGQILARAITVYRDGAWRPWLEKSSFDVARGEFNPAGLIDTTGELGTAIWLYGNVETLQPYLIDADHQPFDDLSQTAPAGGTLLALGEPRQPERDRLVVREVYVVGGACAPIDANWRHCPAWMRVYPKEDVQTIQGQIALVDGDEGKLYFTEPNAGIIGIELEAETELRFLDNAPARLEDIVAGLTVQADGNLGEAGMIAAARLTILP